MEVLIHGIFTLIKLAILGSIYATLILLIFRLRGNIKPTSWTDRISIKKLRFWFISGAIISIGLFAFATSHWGAHGLGDSARIPLRNGNSISEMNGTQAYIENLKYEFGDLWIGEFAITSNFVVGRTKTSPVDSPEDYFVWNLKSNEVNYLNTKEEYKLYARKYELPMPKEFREFRHHYSDYWHGWRFWTLL